MTSFQCNTSNPDFRPFIQGILKGNKTRVSFKKKDGTDRTMLCTLRPDLLPVVENTGEKKARKVNENVIAVFDLEKNEWRSFRYDSVTLIELI